MIAGRYRKYKAYKYCLIIGIIGLITFLTAGIVQVNNILKVASPDGGYQFAAYDEPQVVVRWHDGYTGRLVYAESITTFDARDSE